MSPMQARLDEKKNSPAALNNRSQAALAASGVFSSMNKARSFGHASRAVNSLLIVFPSTVFATDVRFGRPWLHFSFDELRQFDAKEREPIS